MLNYPRPEVTNIQLSHDQLRNTLKFLTHLLLKLDIMFLDSRGPMKTFTLNHSIVNCPECAHDGPERKHFRYIMTYFMHL